jgi:hypothetical protein
MNDNIYTIITQGISVEKSGAGDGVVWIDASTGRFMLGGPADVELDLICTRPAKDLSQATARGQHMGRPGGATLKELGRSYDVSKATTSAFGRRGLLAAFTSGPETCADG